MLLVKLEFEKADCRAQQHFGVIREQNGGESIPIQSIVNHTDLRVHCYTGKQRPARAVDWHHMTSRDQMYNSLCLSQTQWQRCALNAPSNNQIYTLHLNHLKPVFCSPQGTLGTRDL